MLFGPYDYLSFKTVIIQVLSLIENNPVATLVSGALGGMIGSVISPIIIRDDPSNIPILNAVLPTFRKQSKIFQWPCLDNNFFDMWKGWYPVQNIFAVFFSIVGFIVTWLSVTMDQPPLPPSPSASKKKEGTVENEEF